MILWSVINEQVAAVLQQHSDLIMSVAFSPDGALLATASDDQTAKAVAVDKFLPLEELVPIARQRLRRAAP